MLIFDPASSRNVTVDQMIIDINVCCYVRTYREQFYGKLSFGGQSTFSWKPFFFCFSKFVVLRGYCKKGTFIVSRDHCMKATVVDFV